MNRKAEKERKRLEKLKRKQENRDAYKSEFNKQKFKNPGKAQEKPKMSKKEKKRRERLKQ